MALIGAQFVNAVSPNPVGSLQAYAGASAPTGWLMCDGSSYSTSVYPELFSVLSYTYGGSGGSFNVPDLRGRVPVGKDNMGTTGTAGRMTTGQTGSPTWTGSPTTLGSTAGSDKHQLTTAQMPSHTHVQNNFGTRTDVNASGNNGFVTTVATVDIQGGGRGNQNTGGDAAHPNVQPVIVTNYIIKAVPDAPRSGLAYGSTPPIVTALPANPQFGDVVTYIADATNGVAWNLQYDATGTYPWKFIGGAALRSSNTTYPASQNNGTFTDINSGSTVVAPLAGDYMVLHAGRTDSTNPVATGLIEIGAATASIAASGNESAAVGFGANATGVIRGAWSWTQKLSNVAANETVKLQQRVVVGSFSTVYFSTRLDVTPIRVKAA